MKFFLILLLVLGARVTQAQFFGLQWNTENMLVHSGNKAYESGDFAKSTEKYQAALDKDVNKPEAIYNLGDALYQQQKFDDAIAQFNMALSKSADDKSKAEVYHNLGNCLLKSSKVPEAIEAYKNSLKLNPTDDDTRYNLAYAESLKKKQDQQQQQQKKDQKKDSKDQQKQDQQKKDQQKQDQQKQDQQKQDQKKDDQKQGQPQQVKLTKDQAEQLLAALRQKEQEVQKKIQKEKMQAANVQIDKDW